MYTCTHLKRGKWEARVTRIVKLINHPLRERDFLASILIIKLFSTVGIVGFFNSNSIDNSPTEMATLSTELRGAFRMSIWSLSSMKSFTFIC